jgi:hypothetical protein
MTPRLASLLLVAVSTTGSYNPNETLYLVEEQMTGVEYKTAYSFLDWVNRNHFKFGHGNILVRYREYQKAVK